MKQDMIKSICRGEPSNPHGILIMKNSTQEPKSSCNISANYVSKRMCTCDKAKACSAVPYGRKGRILHKSPAGTTSRSRSLPERVQPSI